MENNKWDYEYVRANASQWEAIVRSLVKVANNPTKETLAAADALMQGLLSPNIRS
jgi:hypothetical protein